MDKRSKRIKTLILGAFWCLVVIVYIVRLMNLQLVHGDEYLETAMTRSYKTQTTVAVRGEILDVNGGPLAVNKAVYDLTINKMYIEKANENEVAEKLLTILNELNIEYNDLLPIVYYSDSYDFASDALRDERDVHIALGHAT